MSPLRLAVLAVLIYIGYRLITSGWKNRNTHKFRPTESPMDPTVTDVLVEDPICRTLVPQKQAVRLQHKDKVVYFCSEKCCDNYIKEHDKQE